MANPLNSEFGLTKIALGERTFARLDEFGFSRLRTAVECLLHVLYIEEKYDFIRQNYLTFCQASEKYAREWEAAGAEERVRYAKSELNRHIVNILTTTKLYLDQSIRHAGKLDRLAGNSDLNLVAQTHLQYGRRLGYRVMEALRNYVQHRGDAVHTASFGWERTRSDSGELQPSFRVADLYLDPGKLREDKKFKVEVLNEIDTSSRPPPIQVYLSDYLNGITDIHLHFRQEVSERILEAESTLYWATEWYRHHAGAGGSIVGLAAVERRPTAGVVRRIGLSPNVVSMRKFYEQKELLRPSSALRY